MHRVVALSVVLVALGACEAGTPGIGSISGVVRLGPIMPVCREGVPCDGVYKGARVILTASSGRVEARATANEGGEFVLDAAAGRYAVAVEVPGPMPSCGTVNVLVKAGETVRIEIDCDSGIR